MGRRTFGLLCALLGVAAACTSFSGDDTSAPTADAGADVASPVVDGAPPPPATDGGFCASHDAELCADFDTIPRPWGFDPSFTGASPPGFARIDVTQQPSPSPPNALLAELSPGFDGGSLAVAMHSLAMPASGRIALSANVKVTASAVQVPTGLVSVGLDDVRLVFLAALGDALVASGTASDAGPLGTVTSLPADWVRVRIDVDFTAGTFSVWSNGVKVLSDLPGVKALASDTSLKVVVGASVATPVAATTTVLFDDVLVETL